MLRLGGVTSPRECIERVREACAAKPTGWVLGHGVRVEGWTDPRWPTRAEFDAATGSIPACLMSFDHHAALANSAALTAAGVREDEPNPHDGVYVRDPSTGRLTGLLLESAYKRVWAAAPEPTEAERIAHVRAACTHLASLGFVEVHDLLSPAWLGPALAAMSDEGSLPVRTALFAPLDDLPWQQAEAALWTRPDVRLAGGKLFADGTLNSRTAWMLTDYRDPVADRPRGVPNWTLDDITNAVRTTDALKLQLAVHAIGDGAVRAVLDATERARGKTRPRGLMPVRIEHAEIIDAADVPRFVQLGVIASVQPCHLLTDIEVLRRSLPHRLDRVLPLRELIEAGCVPGETLIFGSDVPIVRAEPEDSIKAAVHRRRANMPASAAIAPEQAISESQAWAAFAASVGGH